MMNNALRNEVQVAESDEEEEAAYQLFYKSYGPSYFQAQEAFNVTRTYDPTLIRKNLFIVKENGIVIAATRTVTRRLVLFGEQFHIGGIAAVVVEPRHRKGGAVFHLLINSVLSEMVKRNLSLCLIFARRAVDHFFVRHGFWGTPVERRFTLLDPPLPEAAPIRFRSIDIGDIPFLEKMHRLVYSSLAVYLERPAELWMSKMKNPSFKERFVGYLCVDDTTSTPLGYVIAGYQGDIIESALYPERSHLYPSIFFAKNSPVREAALGGLSLPKEHPAMRMFSGHAYFSFSRHPNYGGNLLKILNPHDRSSRVMQLVEAQVAQRGVTIPESLFHAPSHEVGRVLTAALFGYEVPETRRVLDPSPSSPWEHVQPIDFIFSPLDDF